MGGSITASASLPKQQARFFSSFASSLPPSIHPLSLSSLTSFLVSFEQPKWPCLSSKADRLETRERGSVIRAVVSVQNMKASGPGANLLTSHLVLELKMCCLVRTAFFTASLQLYQMQNKGETEMYPVPALHAPRGPWVQAQSHSPQTRCSLLVLILTARTVEHAPFFHLLGIN